MQSPAALAALAAAVAAQPVAGLATLGIIVPATGSLVLGLAVVEGAMDAAAATEAAQIDEVYQAEAWGVEEESEERRFRVAGEIALARHVPHTVLDVLFRAVGQAGKHQVLLEERSGHFL